MIDKKAIYQVAGIVVGLLVDGDYKALESMTRRERLTADQMRIAIEDYGQTLVDPPDKSWSSIEIYEVDNSQPPVARLYVPLWTVEEGESDLTVELRMTERHRGILNTEIMNIYVP